ncbi:related to CHA1 - L-serine/L-threonine deaminase [Melanopsichium pennsylvanicum]|uniref:L-serine ammonia-lyase n=2 Tax=Melanopsichium pennsylvanicum TaxID=63383 RepID=A0AAJ4XJC2_9BASI|nr:related to CHA1-L-serine/L-threonine deaminase [Melanopsichium pennsylvanicum 4]SNX83193.1 related to CHA1 - L-serine/L-threonine deaminase [Melanopsichium pennsylvanicum]
MTIPLGSAILSPTNELPTAPNSVPERLHLVTPLVHSSSLSHTTGHNIYLKLDSDQPSGSFKIRGIGKICQTAITQFGSDSTHLISSSGGNAGLAVAYSASRAGVGCTIFVPVSTEKGVVEKLRSNGARVVVGGDSWDQADKEARKLVEEMKHGPVKGTYVHPFEGDELVSGHSGLVDEVFDQFEKMGKGNVDVLISSVGGGGLIRGIIQGVSRQASAGKPEPVLVAVQNFGVNSFNLSFDAYLVKPSCSTLPEDVVTLERIASKCTSMGTKRCSITTLHDAIQFHQSPKTGEVMTLTVTDDLSASACWQFSEKTVPELPKSSGEGDKKWRMIELSCASALTPVYHKWILDSLIQRSKALKDKVAKGEKINMVIEVCGGNKVNQNLLDEYKASAGLMDKRDGIRINGQDIAPFTSA